MDEPPSLKGVHIALEIEVTLRVVLSSVCRNVIIGIVAAGLVVGTTVAAEARTNTSKKIYYGDGAYIVASASLPLIADWHGCGDLGRYAWISKKPNWVKNVTGFQASGIGASVSVNGVGGSVSGSGNNSTITWINNNGALGSYLSGGLCANWLTWYLSMNVTGSAFHYGTVRIANATL